MDQTRSNPWPEATTCPVVFIIDSVNRMKKAFRRCYTQTSTCRLKISCCPSPPKKCADPPPALHHPITRASQVKRQPLLCSRAYLLANTHAERHARCITERFNYRQPRIPRLVSTTAATAQRQQRLQYHRWQRRQPGAAQRQLRSPHPKTWRN